MSVEATQSSPPNAGGPDESTEMGASSPSKRLSVCVLITQPEGEEENERVRKNLLIVDLIDPDLLICDVVWIGNPSSMIQSYQSNHPASTFFLDGMFPWMNILGLKGHLKKKHYDLIDARLFNPTLGMKFIVWMFPSAWRVGSNPFHFTRSSDLPEGWSSYVKDSEPAFPKGESNQSQNYVSHCRTEIRTRSFEQGRPALSLIRRSVGSTFARTGPPKNTLRILMYHRVTDTMEKDILAVTPYAFFQQMRWLKKEGWQIFPLKEALMRLEKGTLPDQSAVITFDDGYRDNYEEAFPVLARFDFTATIFPVTGFVLGESEHRRYRGRNPKVPYLTIDHIQEMKKSGIDFGGHTHSHPLLTKLSSEDSTREIVQAKKLLEEWTGEKSTIFAYPNGDYSRDHFRILDGLGYEAALSVQPGANQRGTLRWTLKRTEISGRDSLVDFIQKMRGGLDLWHSLYQSVKGFYR